MARFRVYVAGPISKGDLAHNLRQAKEAGVALIAAGFAPLVPQFTCYYGDGNEPAVQPHGISHDEWLDCDFAWLDVADALLRLPGESVGADAEVAFANESGIPVFTTLAELLAWRDGLVMVEMGQFVAEQTEPTDEFVTGTELRKAAIAEVEKCVCRDRQHSYGDAEDNFADIATLATVMFSNKLNTPLSSLDVASFCACIKLARIKTSPGNLDNWIDLAGYGVCGAGIVKRGSMPLLDFGEPVECVVTDAANDLADKPLADTVAASILPFVRTPTTTTGA